MPQPNQGEVKSIKKYDEIDYIPLVEIVRNPKKKEAAQNIAFGKIVQGLESRITKIARQFKIPGHTFEDVYQECLVALRYKAIKDYDQTRGFSDAPAAFDHFALLCIRRHLATALKTSHQNKKKILNESKSLDQQTSSDNEELSLGQICPKTSGDVLNLIQRKEYFTILMDKLIKKLSSMEKQVLLLYAQKYSYEEIAEIINKRKGKVCVGIKSIDNSLSRLKKKAEKVYEKHG